MLYVPGEEWAKRHAVAEQERTHCRQAMLIALATDSRYLPETSAPISRNYLAMHNALSGEKRACGPELFRQHEAAFLEACKLHHCGDDVGGGCEHMAGYALNASAIEMVIKKCGT